MMAVNGENTDKRLRKETLVQEHITAARLHLVVLFEDRYLYLPSDIYYKTYYYNFRCLISCNIFYS